MKSRRHRAIEKSSREVFIMSYNINKNEKKSISKQRKSINKMFYPIHLLKWRNTNFYEKE